MRLWRTGACLVATVLSVFALGTVVPSAAAVASADVFIVQLINDNSGYCLAASLSGNQQPVVQTSCGDDVDYWDIYDEGGNQQEIQTSYGAYKCVVARGTGEAPAVATGCDPTAPDQLWQVNHDYQNDLYQFRNVNSKLCLAARGTVPGTQAVQTTCGSYADQWWYIAPA